MASNVMDVPRIILCFVVIGLVANAMGGRVAAAANMTFSAYGGGTVTTATDVHYARPEDTDLDFAAVEWRSEPFSPPIYYGFRLGYWFCEQGRWGLALDVTHDKLLAETDRVVHVTGRRNGLPVDRNERLGDTLSTLGFSHGHNLIVVELIRSWRAVTAAESTWQYRIAPYAGGGLGFTVPHVEAHMDSHAIDEYQLSGPVLAALAGLELSLGHRLGLFAEYKTSYAWLTGELEDIAEIKSRPWTNHLTAGLTYRWEL